ncbi:MAG TPA: HAMP domain-containing protein [Acidimicrobiia bacterium]|nr:HAMP domain-containing protein [Acidimicrobiia bacterium]
MSEVTSSAAGSDAPELRQRRSLRRSLTYTLTAVALLSVLLLGALNYWQARDLITSTVKAALVDQQITRSQAVESGLDRLRNEVSLRAAAPAMVDGIEEFGEALQGLGAGSAVLTEEQEAEVVDAYAQVDSAIEEAGLDAPDLVPASAAARYLQYHYILQNPNPPDERDALVVSETDGSAYAEVHAALHPQLVRLAASPAIANLLLVDRSGTIVYSTDKRIDLGTNLVTGPYRDSALANAVVRQVPAAPVGEAVYADYERYLPAAAEPALFVAAAVRSEATTIGAVVVQITLEGLDAITTSNREWEATGLGETGEAYVVGSDSLMRSTSRLWLEDPQAYLADLAETDVDPEVARLIELFDSTVLVQPADTPAVAAALDGDLFVGRSENYLGHNTLTVASRVNDRQLDWVLVASLDVGEATGPLRSYTLRLLLVAAVLIPVVAILAAILSARMTRPVAPIVAAAADVAGGELTVELPDLGRNEFGDVARRLNTLTSDLREREAALEAEERGITTLLLSALPPRLVQRLRGETGQVGELLDTATIVAISVEGLVNETGIDADSALEFGVRLSRELELVADDLGIERVRSSSGEHVFAAGLATPDPASSMAAEFAVRVAGRIESYGEQIGLELTYQMGMCGGEVVAAVLEADQLTYGVIGDAMRNAVALQSVARPGQILVCEETAVALERDWTLSSVSGLVDLRGEPVNARALAGQPGQPATATVYEAGAAKE